MDCSRSLDVSDVEEMDRLKRLVGLAPQTISVEKLAFHIWFPGKWAQILNTVSGLPKIGSVYVLVKVKMTVGTPQVPGSCNTCCDRGEHGTCTPGVGQIP